MTAELLLLLDAFPNVVESQIEKTVCKQWPPGIFIDVTVTNARHCCPLKHDGTLGRILSVLGEMRILSTHSLSAFHRLPQFQFL